MNVDAAHSSGKLVGPTYYVTSQKREVTEVRCCYFYARDKVPFELRTRRIRLFYR
jgi:hypothetical protein